MAQKKGRIMLDDQGQLKDKRINARQVADRKIDELIGLCRGIMADGTINQKEAEFLMEWISSNEARANLFPFSVLYDRLSNMLSDNILDEDEQIELLDLLTRVTGGDTLAEDIESMSTTLPLCNPAPDVIIEQNNFVFTGVFNMGTRKALQSIVENMGGIAQKSITKQTNYLVIGDIGSEDWAHSSFGRKIEKAIDYKEKGSDIKIVIESHWSKFI